MPSHVFSAALRGIDASVITVEIDISQGLYYFNIVGLPDKSVAESRDRVNAAIKNSGFAHPKKTNQKIIVNLAPADVKKEGALYDLPIAISYLVASDQIHTDLSSQLFVGELALNGDIRPIKGMLAVALLAKEKGFQKLILPAGNIGEASLVSGITLIPVSNLTQCVKYLTGENIAPVQKQDTNNTINTHSSEYDFAYIKGQEHAKRALVVAASGGHNILISGPPGSGKTMLAKAFASILPPLSEKEIIDTTKIHSVACGLTPGQHAIYTRPFRAPHHSASNIALLGGGEKAKLGEISLAHNGVLFLDEFPEFQKNVIESLRQPMEDREITISRAYGTFRYPANFILIATKNPCPCGYYQSDQKECTCSFSQILKYQKKISGPIADRIDIHIDAPQVSYEKLSDNKTYKSESEQMQKNVTYARKIQEDRLQDHHISCNAQMSPKHIKEYCTLDNESSHMLKTAMEQSRLSARSYHKIIKIARTIADMEEAKNILSQHIAEAIQYQPRE